MPKAARLSPGAYALISFVLIVQNVLADLVTGPFSNCDETVFNIHYVLLLMLTRVIVSHIQFVKNAKSFATR